MCCAVTEMRSGASTLNVLRRDGGLCAYCGDKASSVDHIVPVSRYYTPGRPPSPTLLLRLSLTRRRSTLILTQGLHAQPDAEWQWRGRGMSLFVLYLMRLYRSCLQS